MKNKNTRENSKEFKYTGVCFYTVDTFHRILCIKNKV